MARLKVPYVAMHVRGTPSSMHSTENKGYRNLIACVTIGYRNLVACVTIGYRNLIACVTIGYRSLIACVATLLRARPWAYARQFVVDGWIDGSRLLVKLRPRLGWD